MKSLTFSMFVLAGVLPLCAVPAAAHTFKKQQLDNHFWAEGACFIDANKDGKKDVAAGPYWYEAPEFTKKHEIYPATATFDLKKPDGTVEKTPGFEGALGKDNKYSDNFFAFSGDFNADGWPDLLIIGFPGEWTSWYENPKGAKGPWAKHIALRITDNESPTFTDVTGDGKAELICSSQGRYGYATPNAADPNGPWTWHPISPNNKYQRFTHGLGVGDVNGDGRKDYLEANGWWEQPASLAGDPEWTFHKVQLNGGGAQMYAYDVNGDGLNDVVTSMAAHGYGLAWHEQVKKGDEITFIPHIFMGDKPEASPYKVRFGELHAVDLVDVNGDGLKDIVTGKRFWSHGDHGNTVSDTVAPIYWFELKRGADKSVDWIPHQIDGDSGVGTQADASDDWNGDKLNDIVISNKRGTFVFTHEAAAK